VNLTVDIGNTTIKLVVFDSSKVVARYVINHEDVFDMQDLINTYSIQNSIVSTVTTSKFPWMSLLTKNTHCIRVNHAIRIPFTSSYSPFEQLGLDRVVGLSAAIKMFPEEDVLVIDVGVGF
jgi:type III pantothenate kinase